MAYRIYFDGLETWRPCSTKLDMTQNAINVIELMKCDWHLNYIIWTEYKSQKPDVYKRQTQTLYHHQEEASLFYSLSAANDHLRRQEHNKYFLRVGTASRRTTIMQKEKDLHDSVLGECRFLVMDRLLCRRHRHPWRQRHCSYCASPSRLLFPPFPQRKKTPVRDSFKKSETPKKVATISSYRTLLLPRIF